jgi:hypothetical protein
MNYLENVNEVIRGLKKNEVLKVSNSLQKRLNDENYAKYNGFLEQLMRKTFK